MIFILESVIACAVFALCVFLMSRDPVGSIVNHPLIPSDVTVRGFIIDSATGELTEVEI